MQPKYFFVLRVVLAYLDSLKVASGKVGEVWSRCGYLLLEQLVLAFTGLRTEGERNEVGVLVEAVLIS